MRDYPMLVLYVLWTPVDPVEGLVTEVMKKLGDPRREHEKKMGSIAPGDWHLQLVPERREVQSEHQNTGRWASPDAGREEDTKELETWRYGDWRSGKRGLCRNSRRKLDTWERKWDG